MSIMVITIKTKMYKLMKFLHFHESNLKSTVFIQGNPHCCYKGNMY